MRKLLVPLFFLACSGAREHIEPEKSDMVQEQLPAPAGTSKISVRQLRGTGPDDIWAIAVATVDGKSGRELFAQGYHFDGKSWTFVEVPARVTALAPVAKNDVWAVGRFGTVAHWDGRAWHEDKLAIDWDLIDVAAAGGLIWVADATSTLHRFDGKTWDTVKPEPLARTPAQHLTSVAGHLFVPASYQKDIAIAHFDGKEWRREAMVGADLGLVRIAGSALDDVWGFAVTDTAFHFDGKTWRRAETPASGKDSVIGAAAVAPTEAWAVGENGLVMRWDGHDWKRVASGTRARLWTVWATAGAPVFVGGDAGLLRLSR